MAFLREYAAQGDPFSFRVPKRLRKLKVGRALGRVASFAAPFIPGIGIPLMVAKAAARFGVSPESLMGFARAHGIPMGDPGAPKPSAKRKSAAAGPKHKAEKKREKRAERSQRAGHAQPKRRQGRKGGGAAGMDAALQFLQAGAGGASRAAGQAIEHFTGVNLQEAFGAGGGPDGAGAMPMGPAPVFRGGKRGFGGGHRRINPTNVKALNRGLRRIEGFEKLAKRVMGHKLFRKVRGAPHLSSMGQRLHKAGCGCVICKR